MPDTLAPRQSAVRILTTVLASDKTLDNAVSADKNYQTFTESDRHFIKLLLLTTLRHMGQIDGVLKKVIQKPIGKKNQTVQNILRLSVAQGLFLNTPDYAFVNTAVALTKKMRFVNLARFVNGVLRNILRLKNPLEGLENPALNIPDWLYQSWQKTYGADETNLIATALLNTPPLDITVQKNPEIYAQKWNGNILPTGSIRVSETSPERLADFQDGNCWVQNAAASVPAQLFSNLKGKKVADLCAAPGGKTAQLANRGAFVHAFDISEKRLTRLHENMTRLGFEKQVQTTCADILSLNESEPFDAVLLDAPCSATGTIARHPELKYHRTPDDIIRLATLQKQLLKKAISITKSGGEIVFSTCSLQPEEGDEVIQSALDKVDVIPITDARFQAFKTDFGSLRFLPSQGFDGFYACLMKKK